MDAALRRSLLLACVGFGIVGCSAESPLPAEGQGPCEAVWGPVPSGGRLYVDSAADAGGDGSLNAPFRTLEDALGTGDAAVDAPEAARSSGVRSIALADGDYAGHFLLSGDTDAWQDSGLEVVGCGEGTAFDGVVESVDGVDVLQPVFDITGESTSAISIRDLLIRGGRRPITIRGGAGADGAIGVHRVTVRDAVRVGVLVDGLLTRAELIDVTVDGVDVEGGIGWGVAVQTRAWVSDELAGPTVLDRLTVGGASGVGVLVDGGWVDFNGCDVSGTAAVEGVLGRGIQLQNRSAGVLADVESDGNGDAALFIHKPGRDAGPVEVVRGRFSGTAASQTPDGGVAADGIVIGQGADQQPVGTFQVTLSAVSIEGNPRANLLADRVTVVVDGVDGILADGTKLPVVAQHGASISGIDAEVLSDDEALGLHSEALGLEPPLN